MSDHLVESYDKQLELINSNLVKMGGLVEQQVKDSLKALDDTVSYTHLTLPTIYSV